jgi:MFS family permease
VYTGFAWFQSPLAPWVLLSIYGLYQALTEGVMKALVSDIVPQQLRASAIGLLATVGGLGQLAASIVAGAVWHVRVLDQLLMLPFAIGAVGALAAVPIIASVNVPRRLSATPVNSGQRER